jgi:tRNA1Val (adenine37-N6)-methyltransferase
MSNHYFQFKQFTIQQEHVAMKVSTDACILGAWTPIDEKVNSVLDIGTGTGLLSLMLAQRNPNISIDAIEIDTQASTQAKENITNAPWLDRVSIIHADARDYNFKRQYELIICNPPFFINSLLGPVENRNDARHTLSFNYTDLLNLMNKVLASGGYASVLLPLVEHNIWEELLKKNNWQISHKVYIKPRAATAANRVICLCSNSSDKQLTEEELVIYEQDKSYTETFSKLMSPFYLKL